MSGSKSTTFYAKENYYFETSVAPKTPDNGDVPSARPIKRLKYRPRKPPNLSPFDKPPYKLAIITYPAPITKGVSFAATAAETRRGFAAPSKSKEGSCKTRHCDKDHHRSSCRLIKEKCGECGSAQLKPPRRLCQALLPTGIQNKTLIQITEANKAADFRRILNSNAILSSAWPQARPDDSSIHADDSEIPQSTYSVVNISETYNYLFQRHIDTVQELICSTGGKTLEGRNKDSFETLEKGIFGSRLHENLYNLSEFYDDDLLTESELQNYTNAENGVEAKDVDHGTRVLSTNYNVDLANLIGDNDAKGENYNDSIAYPDSDSNAPRSLLTDELFEETGDDIFPAIMSSVHGEVSRSHRLIQPTTNGCEVNHLISSFKNIEIHNKQSLPAITFSDCCDRSACFDSSPKSPSTINLTVPLIHSNTESRPPTSK